MMGSTGHRTAVAAFVIFVLVLSGTIPAVSGGSQWTQQGTDFSYGTADNLTFAAGKLSLDFKACSTADWKMMMAGDPSGRSKMAFGYDPGAVANLMFGGGGNQADTWYFNASNNSWLEKNPNQSPPGRDEAAMVFDSRNNVSVLFGGSSMMALNDTWVYTATLNNWTRKTPVTTPPERSSHAMAYDSANGVIVLFGGWTGVAALGDTWVYNLSSNTWTNKNPSSPPSARSYHRMAYDPVNGVVVCFGGYDTAYRSDTWTYNVSTNTWASKSPSSPPSARGSHSLVYDTRNGVCVLFGGAGNSGLLSDTWTYNAGTNVWSNKGPASAPSARTQHGMTFDLSKNLTILYGGWTGSASSLDIWSYDAGANSWTNTTPSNRPSPRQQHVLVYDRDSDAFVLFGGRSMNGALDDTWAYSLDTNNWTRKSPLIHPGPRSGAAMVYDSVNDVMVLFGGQDGSMNALSEVWTYDLDTNVWTIKNPSPGPVARSWHAMVFDDAAGVSILFGGITNTGTRLNDTWVYNTTGNAWTDKNPLLRPSRRSECGMCYDTRNGLVIVFGGMDFNWMFLNETWTYQLSTNTWTKKTPATSPMARDNMAMAFDSSAGEAFLFGGLGAPVDNWAYNASNNTWMQRSPAHIPAGRAFSAMAYDNSNGGMLLFGGSANSDRNDVWAYNVKTFIASGMYTSVPFDTGASAYFGTIGWTGTVSLNTTVKMQFRTADTGAGLSSKPFVGPDATALTFYTLSGQHLHPGHNGSRWMQYRAFLATVNPVESPALKNLSVTYNRLHILNITSPAGAENWTGNRNITWNASDTDNDSLSFDLYLENATGSTPLATGLPNGTSRWQWDTTQMANGNYSIRIVARDSNAGIPLSVNVTSGPFTVYHSPPNHHPSAQLLEPSDGAIITTTSVNLSWDGSDPDGTSLTYRIFLQDSPIDTGMLPAPVNITNAIGYTVSGLTDGTTYFWTVIPFDGLLSGNAPEPRNFTVRLPTPNHQPSVTLLSPANNSLLNVTSVQLAWTGADIDNDTLTYHVFLSSSPLNPNALPAPAAMLLARNHTVSNLTGNTTYYWTVVPSDGKLNGTAPGTYNFKVQLPAVNSPPLIMSTPPVNATVGSLYRYNVTASDMDGDVLSFSFLVSPQGMTIDASTGRISWTPTSAQKGLQSARLRVSDGRGGSDEQHFNITVTEIAVAPGCTIISPSNGTTVSKSITVNGKAVRGTAQIVKVEVRLDGGDWKTASGTENWSFDIDVSKLPKGRHTIAARASDGSLGSQVTSIEIIVEKPSVPVSGENNLVIPLLVITCIIGAVAAAGLILRKKKGQGPQTAPPGTVGPSPYYAPPQNNSPPQQPAQYPPAYNPPPERG